MILNQEGTVCFAKSSVIIGSNIPLLGMIHFLIIYSLDTDLLTLFTRRFLVASIILRDPRRQQHFVSPTLVIAILINNIE